MEDKRATPYPLRLDPDIREALQKMADKNGIPLSQEINAHLKKAVQRPATLESIDERLEMIRKDQKRILDELDTIKRNQNQSSD